MLLGFGVAVLAFPYHFLLLSQALRERPQSLLGNAGISWNAPSNWVLYATKDGVTGEVFHFGVIAAKRSEFPAFDPETGERGGHSFYWLRLSGLTGKKGILMYEMSFGERAFFRSEAGKLLVRSNPESYQYEQDYIIDRISRDYTQVWYPNDGLTIIFPRSRATTESEINSEFLEGLE